jgi:uncharacterized protein (DUF488 family)
MAGVSKYSISLGTEESLLADAMMEKDEKFSHFIQRLIREEASRRGLAVEIKVVEKR